MLGRFSPNSLSSRTSYKTSYFRVKRHKQACTVCKWLTWKLEGKWFYFRFSNIKGQLGQKAYTSNQKHLHMSFHNVPNKVVVFLKPDNRFKNTSHPEVMLLGTMTVLRSFIAGTLSASSGYHYSHSSFFSLISFLLSSLLLFTRLWGS